MSNQNQDSTESSSSSKSDFKKQAFSFFRDFVAKPLHDIGMATREVLSSIGIQQKIDAFVYKNIEDPLLHLWFTKSYDFKIENDEVIPPEGGVIIVSNHQSIMDPLITGLAVVHNSHRIPYILTKIELRDDPFLGVYVSSNFAIYVRRGESDEEAYKKSIEVLTEKEEPLVIYPEGTYGPGHGELLPFKTGAVRLAWDTKKPIIPLAVYGVDEIMGAEASRKFKPPKAKGIIHTKFGNPLNVKDLFPNATERKPPSKDDYKNAADKLHKIVSQLWQELADEVEDF